MPLPATTLTGPFYSQMITQSATVGLKFKLPADWKAETGLYLVGWLRLF